MIPPGSRRDRGRAGRLLCLDASIVVVNDGQGLAAVRPPIANGLEQAIVTKIENIFREGEQVLDDDPKDVLDLGDYGLLQTIVTKIENIFREGEQVLDAQPSAADKVHSEQVC